LANPKAGLPHVYSAIQASVHLNGQPLVALASDALLSSSQVSFVCKSSMSSCRPRRNGQLLSMQGLWCCYFRPGLSDIHLAITVVDFSVLDITIRCQPLKFINNNTSKNRTAVFQSCRVLDDSVISALQSGSQIHGWVAQYTWPRRPDLFKHCRAIEWGLKAGQPPAGSGANPAAVRGTGTPNYSSISWLKVSTHLDASRRVQASMNPTSSLCNFRGRSIRRASGMIPDWWNPRIVRAIRVRPTLSWLAISSKVQCARCILIISASIEVVIEGGESDLNWKIGKWP
jgi:hypothetical protein